jgi:fibronectin-binding autotransporter adhesin
MNKRILLIVVLSLVLPMLAAADNISMTANDAGGDSSLLNAGKWSNVAPPNATNDYFSSVYYIRTPLAPTGGTTNIMFAGHSLTLQTPVLTGTGQVNPIRSIIFKGSSNSVTIINNLTNSGGVINAGSGNVPGIFGGNLMTVASNSTIQADQGPFQIDYPLAGSADLTNTSGQGRTITYTGTNSAFTGRFYITNNVIVVFNSTSSIPGNPAISTPDQIAIGGGCTLQDNAGVTYNHANGGITLLGSATINASATNLSGANVPTVVSTPITDNGNGYNLTKRGLSILRLSGNNTFGGGLSLMVATAGSQLDINSATALGTGPFVLVSGGVAPAILDNTSGSPITLANNNSQAWSNNFVFIGSSSLNLGSGAVVLGSNITATVSNNNLTVGPVSDGGLGWSLTKSGPGTLTLNAGNSFTGATIVSNGVLALTGSGSLSSSSLFLATSAATLDVTGVGGLALASGQALAGNGTVSGAVAAGSGTILAPGGNNVAGTLTVNGNLTLNGGTLNVDLTTTTTPGGGTNDLVVVTGTLNLSSPSTINVSGSPLNGNWYTLIQYGAFAGSLANLSLPGFILTNNAALNAIQVLKVHVPTTLTWRGDGTANVWDSGITVNWLQSGTNQVFLTGDTVIFDNTGSNTPAINLAGTISPAATTVNSSRNHVFTGSGILTGGLTKDGSGTLTLDNNNSYPGNTVVNAGVLQVGNGGGSGTLGLGSITNNGTLVFNRTNSVTVLNNISGAGGLTMAGTGDLILGNATTGSNSYNGLTQVSSTGTLHPRNSSSFGAATNGLVSTNGGRLYLDVNITDFPNLPLTLGGGTALQKGGAGVSTLGGAVALVSDTTFSVDGGATLNLTNATGVNGASANANLTLAGTGTGNIPGPLALGAGNLTVSGGTWTVAPTNSYSGLTTINGGGLFITGPLSLSQPPGSFNPSQLTLNGGALGTATNVTLNDGNIGITVTSNSTITVNNTGATLAIANAISGDATLVLTKTGSGRLVLSGANSFSGTLNIDGNSNSGNDGVTVIANDAAIANILAVPGFPFINIRNNNSGSSTLALDGTSGPITVLPDIALSGRNNTVPAIENIAGNNTISGGITMGVGGTFYGIQSDSGTLTLAATLPVGTPTNIVRTLTFQGGGNIAMSGVIQDGSYNGTSNVWISVVKLGGGELNLSAANTYNSSTLVSNGVLSLTGSIGSGGVNVGGGLLAGTGAIAGPVTVVSGGAIEAGSTSTIGTLNLGSTLALSGNTLVKINKGAAASDRFSGQTGVTYGGTLTVTNLGGTLTTNDSFTLFSPGASASKFAGIIGSPGPGLAYRFTNGVLSVVGMATNPTNIWFTVSGNTLTLSWPVDHLGWILQSQTNSLGSGLSANWQDVVGSDSSNTNVIAINPSSPAVFYRMRLP